MNLNKFVLYDHDLNEIVGRKVYDSAEEAALSDSTTST